MADVFSGFEALLGSIKGVGEDSKSKSKSDKEIAKLQGKIQKELQAQQAQYAQQLAAQQQQAALQMQEQQQQFQKPFNEAELTGYYNGQQTLSMQQMLIQKGMDERKLALAELTQQQQNAVAQGNLELAREIQTRQQNLAEQQAADEKALETMKLSGRMEDGYLTEEARQNRLSEANQYAQTMGYYMPSYAQVVPEGNVGGFAYNDERSYWEATRLAQQAGTYGQYSNMEMTDAAKQWRTTAALQYAQTAAQLAQNPADYFESAAFMRGADASGATGFLQDINTTGIGSNLGFRSAQQGLPQTNSMQNIAGQPPAAVTNEQSPGFQRPTTPTGQPAPTGPVPDGQMMFAGGGGAFNERGSSPSASIEQARAARAGEPVLYTTQMHQELPPEQPKAAPMQAQFATAQAAVPQMGTATAPQSTYNAATQARLNAFAPTFQQGAHKLAPGALEALSPTERSLFNSAAKASGIRPEDFDSAYKRSRLQTGVGATAM